MKPGQRTPNEFEIAILLRLASGTESLRGCIGALHVLSREFSGVGSFTTFQPNRALARPDLGEQQLGLDVLINVPGVPNGMGAVLFCKDGCPDMLETYTYGDPWDGTFTGFSID